MASSIARYGFLFLFFLVGAWIIPPSDEMASSRITSSYADSSTYHLLPDTAEDEPGPAAKVLKPYIVTNQDFYRRELYSWVSREELEEIRDEGKVLLDDDGEQGELDHYEDGLEHDEFERHPLSNILREDRFENRRFAWPHVWPIVKGLEGEARGSALLKVTLKKEALICRVNPHYPDSLRLVNRNGEEIPPERYSKVRRRIAAVYYVNDIYEKDRFVNPSKKYSRVERKYMEHLNESFFRGYVLVNEDMIASFSHGPDSLSSKLKEERELLQELKEAAKKKGQPRRFQLNFSRPDRVWDKQRFYKDLLLERYALSLAYPHEFYYLEPNKLNGLLTGLKEAM